MGASVDAESVKLLGVVKVEAKIHVFKSGNKE